MNKRQLTGFVVTENMAAHMHRLLRVPGVLHEKSSLFRRECITVSSVYVRLMSGNSDRISSSNDTVPESKDSPNQAEVVTFSTLDENRPDISRNRRQLPTLLKSSYEEEKSSSVKSFAKLFRESNFVHLGSPRGKIVVGTIYRVVSDDLYVDFDWKFPCIVKRPVEDAHLYVNNATVRLRILDLEMSTIFLGAEKETTLNEANCALMGLLSSPLGAPSAQ